MEVLLSHYQLDVISAKATKSMHDEFDSYGEPDLKKSFPHIPAGIVRHIQMQMVKMFVEHGEVWESFVERVRELRNEYLAEGTSTRVAI